jgi:hypothetical protein
VKESEDMEVNLERTNNKLLEEHAKNLSLKLEAENHQLELELLQGEAEEQQVKLS